MFGGDRHKCDRGILTGLTGERTDTAVPSDTHLPTSVRSLLETPVATPDGMCVCTVQQPELVAEILGSLDCAAFEKGQVSQPCNSSDGLAAGGPDVMGQDALHWIEAPGKRKPATTSKTAGFIFRQIIMHRSSAGTFKQLPFRNSTSWLPKQKHLQVIVLTMNSESQPGAQ